MLVDFSLIVIIDAAHWEKETKEANTEYSHLI